MTREIVQGLCQLHSREIIHCDLKPENIMLTEDQQVRISDLGAACAEKEVVSKYIQSPFYRAPEVILRRNVDKAIDIWSLGCIVAELSIGKPIFPGINEWELLLLASARLGHMPESLITNSPRQKQFIAYKNSHEGITEVLLSELISDKKVLKFVMSCLKWNPEERITAKEALASDFLSGPLTRKATAWT